jgi:hypothetical protein
MTQDYPKPIAPPPELVQQWWEESNHRQYTGSEAEDYVVSMAAQWGADQQLAEDAKWLDHNALNESYLRITPVGESLKEAMRPKPPSLKEQALQALSEAVKMADDVPPEGICSDQADIIRRALEQLDD